MKKATLGMMEEFGALERAWKIYGALEQLESGAPMTEAYRKAGVSAVRLGQIVRANGGIDGAKEHILRRIHAERKLRDAVLMYLDGEGIKVPAEAVGVSEDRLRNRIGYLRQHGLIEAVSKRTSRRKLAEAVELLRDGKSLGEVVKEMKYKSLYTELYCLRLEGNELGFEFHRNRHIKKEEK